MVPVFDVDDDDMNSSVAVAFTDDQYTGSSATLHLLLVVLLRSCCCFHGKIICVDLICRWLNCKYKCEYLYTKNNHINCDGSKNLTNYNEVLQKICDKQESYVAH